MKNEYEVESRSPLLSVADTVRRNVLTYSVVQDIDFHSKIICAGHVAPGHPDTLSYESWIQFGLDDWYNKYIISEPQVHNWYNSYLGEKLKWIIVDALYYDTFVCISAVCIKSCLLRDERHLGKCWPVPQHHGPDLKVFILGE